MHLVKKVTGLEGFKWLQVVHSALTECSVAGRLIKREAELSADSLFLTNNSTFVLLSLPKVLEILTSPLNLNPYQNGTSTIVLALT